MEIILLEKIHANPMEIEMSNFIECIDTGQKPLTDAVSSCEGLKVIWELYIAEEKNIVANLQGLGLGSTNFD